MTPCVRERLGNEASDSAVAERAAQTARTTASLAQGYIANTAVCGPRDVGEFVESVVSALAE